MTQTRQSDPRSAQGSAVDSSDSFSETLEALRDNISEQPSREYWGRDIAALGVLAAVFGVVMWYAVLSGRDQPQLLYAEISTNLPAEQHWIGTGFAKGLRTYVQAANKLRLVGKSQVQVASVFSSLWGSEAPSLEGSGAGWLVRVDVGRGSSNDSLKVSLNLSSTSLPRKQFSTQLNGEARSLSDLSARAALQIFDWLEVDPFSAQQRRQADAEIPVTGDAQRLFAEGLRALGRQEGRTAIDYLQQALRQSSDHPMIYEALATAYASLGYMQTAREQIALANEHGHSLSREKQLSIAAREHLLNHEWQRAEELFRSLKEFYPNEINYALALAEAQYHGNRYEAALRTLRELKASPGRLGDDPRIDLLETIVWARRGNYANGIAAAERTIVRAESLGQAGTVARALVWIAELDGDSSGEGLERAQRIFESTNDPVGQSQVLRELGDRSFNTADFDNARNYYRQAIALSQSVQNEAEVALGERALAIVYDLKGDLQQGLALKKNLLANYQRRDERDQVGITLENMGISYFKMGRMNDANVSFAKALSVFQEVGDEIGIAWAPYHKGRIVARSGHLDRARDLIQQAIDNARSRPEGYLDLHARFELVRVEYFGGSLEKAESMAASLATDYQEAELELDYAETLVLMARIQSALGRTDKARANLGRALKIFEQGNAYYYWVSAKTLQLQMGDRSMCSTLLEHAPSLQHRLRALLAMISMRHCPNYSLNAEALKSESEELGLIEPLLALIALDSPQRYRELAISQGWRLRDE